MQQRNSNSHTDPRTLSAGVDADLIIYVSTRERSQCGSTLAAAAACAFDPVTNRPLAGNLIFCKIDPSVFDKDLATAVHEVLHVLVRCPAEAHEQGPEELAAFCAVDLPHACAMGTLQACHQTARAPSEAPSGQGRHARAPACDQGHAQTRTHLRP